jgi:DMSO/TMAO reductase YedYZ heme-binding membrane subunit
MNPQLWWYVSRASGLVAWCLLTLSVCWGIALSTRLLGRKAQPPRLLAVHRFLGGTAVVFVAIHILGISADNYVHFGWADVSVPMASKWRTGAVAWGVVAMYLLLAVELSSLMMKRLPKRLWRSIHLTSFVLYAMSHLHAILAGHDVQARLYRVAALTTIQVVAYLSIVRILAGRRATQLAGRRRRDQRSDEPTTSELQSA